MKYIKIEYGVETFNNIALRNCNRGHSAEDSITAINLTTKYNIPIGAHFILGLPGDSQDSIINNSKIISNLNISLSGGLSVSLTCSRSFSISSESSAEKSSITENPNYSTLPKQFQKLSRFSTC